MKTLTGVIQLSEVC